MTTRHAACRCGQLKAVAEGEPIRISMCHCLACQLRTGSVFGVQARFTRDNVRVDGRSSEYVRTADSGNRVIYHFCPDCGSTVHYSLEQFPDVIAIPVGAFADSNFPPPRYSVYESRRHAWAGAPPDAEHFE
ncbi:MAG: GFA family protein [Steroidobacter sp.]